MAEESAPQRYYLDAEIAPSRSMSKRGMAIVIGAVAVTNLVTSALFLSMGATLVPIFLGVDVLAIAVAFLVVSRSGKRRERVRVTADELSVSFDLGRGETVVWRSAPAFTRVDVEAPGKHESRVRLSSKGRGYVVAADLSPKERLAFARALQTALADARAERWPA